MSSAHGMCDAHSTELLSPKLLPKRFFSFQPKVSTFLYCENSELLLLNQKESQHQPFHRCPILLNSPRADFRPFTESPLRSPKEWPASRRALCQDLRSRLRVSAIFSGRSTTYAPASSRALTLLCAVPFPCSMIALA